MDNNADFEVECDQENWLPLHPLNNKSLTKKQADLQALVLDSRSIPCMIKPDGSAWQILVPQERLDEACNELRQYSDRNRDWPPRLPPSRALIENTLPTISILILLATFHNLTLLSPSTANMGFIDLHALGMAHASAIRDGQWWRVVTALTLHANLTHLASNLTIGGAFIIFLCKELGSGLSWSLLLTTGILGNLVNAIVQSPDHRSVGASTAVFGAVGILSAISMMRYRRHLLKRWFIPVAAGLALLALLGAEGKQTDLGAHLFGFIFGILCGIISEFVMTRYGRPGPLLNTLLALVSTAIVITAWWMAIELSG